MTDSPVSCKICGAHWDFATTWLGELKAIHPVTKCIPKPETWNVECSACEATLRLAADPGNRKIFWCSEKCRVAIIEEKKAKDRAACRRYARKPRPKTRIPFNPEERSCIECGKSFKPVSIYAAKQFLCGYRCQQIRGYRKKKAA